MRHRTHHHPAGQSGSVSSRVREAGDTERKPGDPPGSWGIEDGPVPDRVVLLHGLAAGRRSMRVIQRALLAQGFQVLNPGYPSLRSPLSELVELLHQKLADEKQVAVRTHFVTYSMGGLLARAYLARYRPSGLGRVVMIAPPNRGSELADLVCRIRLARWVLGPSARELGTARSPETTALLSDIAYPLGIIAGNRFLDPLGWMLIPGANDGRVSVRSTMVPGMTGHAVIPASHHGIVRNRDAVDHVVSFLTRGEFPSLRARGSRCRAASNRDP
ncbi:esterase/lipase family protein [Rhizosaccharibacter radicis]|uniref:Alpha/beta hydrolase n=1 Tax=Rhizosaccharibacter radicis TaxID=2782605 RepID=A0ABT1VX33_9PROT|nr:alpha/beta hydrolase [Acetobacteraceae bacterium KSS12]